MNNVILIAMTEAKIGVEAADGGLVERLEASMKAVKNHWMCTDKNEQLQAALGAVMEFYGSESDEYRHIVWETGNIGRINSALSSASSGVSVDWDTVVQESDEFEAIGLVKMWTDILEDE